MRELETIQKKVDRCLRDHSMISGGAFVVVAVSGGADSLCLLILLHRLASVWSHKGSPFTILCAHYNHCLRGEISDAEEAFVQAFCAEHDIPFVSERGDVLGYAREHHLGLEEAARTMRYAFLQRVAAEHQGIIAVAHSRADRVETIVHNVGRGCSTVGLNGISYVRGNVIRPILDLTRQETEQVCKLCQVEYREDASNRDFSYRRNRIRHVILPFLREKLDADIDDKLLRLAELSRLEQDYLQEQSNDAFRQYAIVRPFDLGGMEVSLSIAALRNLHRALQGRLLRMALSAVEWNGERIFPDGVGLEEQMVRRILCAVEGNSSTWVVQIGRQVICQKVGESLLITREIETNASQTEEGEVLLTVPKQIYTGSGVLQLPYTLDGFKSCLSVSWGENTKTEEPSADLVYFDGDRLAAFLGEQPLVWRTKQRGDRFWPWGSGEKSLGSFLIDQKIPAAERKRLPLLAAGTSILWIPGVRRGSVAPLDSSTNHVIMFKIASLQ